jgi:hypothetical protein
MARSPRSPNQGIANRILDEQYRFTLSNSFNMNSCVREFAAKFSDGWYADINQAVTPVDLVPDLHRSRVDSAGDLRIDRGASRETRHDGFLIGKYRRFRSQFVGGCGFHSSIHWNDGLSSQTFMITYPWQTTKRNPDQKRQGEREVGACMPPMAKTLKNGGQVR